jgi:hypothetical protein
VVAPSADAVRSVPTGPAPVGAWMVVLLATLIGVSVLAGSLRPSHRSVFAPAVPRAA